MTVYVCETLSLVFVNAYEHSIRKYGPHI